MTRAYSRDEVRSLPIRARRPLGRVSGGDVKTRARGAQGLEFADFREYEAGDEVGRIDWNVTARLGKPWVRTYLEERGFPVLVMADVSASTRCGRGGAEAGNVIGDLAARLASAAIWNGCETGLLLFGDRVRKYLPAAAGVAQLTRIVRALRDAPEADEAATDIGAALDFALKARRSLVFLLSDFLCGSFADALRRCAGQHEIVAIGVDMARAAEIGDCELVNARDPETGAAMQMDTSSAAVREALRSAFAELRERNAQTFRQTGADYLDLNAGDDCAGAVAAFLRQRAG